mgnify:CR=1 FL=1
MAHKIKKPQRGVSKEFFRSSDRNLAKIQAAITELDACVSGYEKRWGIDRLPELVSTETQVKYWSQVDKLERGHDELTGNWFECQTKDGRVVIVASSFAESHKAARERPDALVYAIDEVATIICNNEAGRFVNAVKDVFPVATVESVRQVKDKCDDEIPF